LISSINILLIHINRQYFKNKKTHYIFLQISGLFIKPTKNYNI
jgi:hypothetical protein